MTDDIGLLDIHNIHSSCKYGLMSRSLWVQFRNRKGFTQFRQTCKLKHELFTRISRRVKLRAFNYYLTLMICRLAYSLYTVAISVFTEWEFSGGL